MKPTPTFPRRRPPSSLGRCGRLYDWRDDLRTLTMRRILEPWTPQDDERLKAFAVQGVSVVRAAAALRRRKGIVRARARKLGCPFPPLRVVRQNGPTRRTMNGEIKRPGLQIRVRVGYSASFASVALRMARAVPNMFRFDLRQAQLFSQSPVAHSDCFRFCHAAHNGHVDPSSRYHVVSAASSGHFTRRVLT
jgi:hypothetical protein